MWKNFVFNKNKRKQPNYKSIKQQTDYILVRGLFSQTINLGTTYEYYIYGGLSSKG